MKQTISISGEVPVKKNSYQIGKNGGLYKPKKITDFEELVSGELLAQKIKAIPDDAEITIESAVFYIKRDKDLDGMMTTVLDALQDGGMFKNDSKVMRIRNQEKIIAPKSSGVIIIISY